MAKTIRYGIIGCGTHAYRGHFLPALKVPGLKLVAICDPGYADASAFTNDIVKGVRLCKKEDKFFYADDIDAVVICSPDKFHAAQLERAVANGKHVLVDKPAAVTTDELKRLDVIRSEAKDRKLVISSCHPRRFNPAYTQVRALLPEWTARFGKPLQLALDFSYHEPSKTGLHTGMLADHLNHEIDFLRFVFGHSGCTAHKLLDSQDRYEAAGMRDDGIAFYFSGTRRLKSKTYPETIRLRFERGEVSIQTCSGMIMEHPHESMSVGLTETRLRKGSPMNYEAAFEGIMRNFAEAIRGKEPCYLTPKDIKINSSACVWLTKSPSWDCV